MNNGTRRGLAGSIHKVREFELEKVSSLLFTFYIFLSTVFFTASHKKYVVTIFEYTTY